MFVCVHLLLQTYRLDSLELMENSSPQAANRSGCECVLQYVLSLLTQRNQGGTALCRKKSPSPGDMDCAKVGREVSLSFCHLHCSLQTIYWKNDSFSKTCCRPFIPSICSFNLLFHMLCCLPKHIASSSSSSAVFFCHCFFLVK